MKTSVKHFSLAVGP